MDFPLSHLFLPLVDFVDWPLILSSFLISRQILEPSPGICQ